MADQPAIDGIVLAAGASRRMGEPKPLLEVDGASFVEHAIKLLRNAGCRYVVAVVNGDDDWIARLADTSGAAVVINEQTNSEQIDSLRLGIANLPDGYEAVLVLPVDFPRVQPATIERLLAEYARQPAGVLNPAYQGQPGHPVLFARDVAADLLHPDLPAGARTVIEQHAAEARTIDVDDAGVLIDIDTPADYERYVRAAQ
ncbi:MAG TPA: nucleotidyltransferase family protein [Longimicrobiales bacterium]|nr:nucleotidyltransferase family protein [Longimicrobiales bacterium]